MVDRYEHSSWKPLLFIIVGPGMINIAIAMGQSLHLNFYASYFFDPLYASILLGEGRLREIPVQRNLLSGFS